MRKNLCFMFVAAFLCFSILFSCSNKKDVSVSNANNNLESSDVSTEKSNEESNIVNTTSASKETTINENVNETETESVVETSTEEKKNYIIGIGQFAEHPSLDNCRDGFIAGLNQKGISEGDNLTIIYDNAQTDGSTASQIFTNYNARNVDLMVAIATPMAQAAYSVTEGKNIPIVYTAVTDPVASELTDSFGNPLGNITGTSDKLPVKEQLELIKKMCPDAKKIGILYTTSEINSISSINEYKELAPNYGFQIIDKGISQVQDLPLAVDEILTKVDVLNNVTDNTVVASLPLVLEKASAKKIPVFGSEVEQVKMGCVACVGIDYFALGKQTGWIAARILNGEEASSIHYETIQDADTFFNTKAIINTGIIVDGDLLNSAKEVYDTISY